MKAYYETNRENILQVHVSRNNDYAFRKHFHSHLELLLVKRGRCKVCCNGLDYTVTDGQIAFFDSYDIHGYQNNEKKDCDHAVVIIPLSICKNFIAKKKSFSVNSPIITDENLCASLLEIVDRIFSKPVSSEVLSIGVNLFLTLLFPKIDFVERKETSRFALIKEILDYVHLNFKNDITLQSVAKEFGYSEAHVSRVFKHFLKKSLGQYVNDLRVLYVKEQVEKDDNLLITDLIFESGFKSVQTYYRNLNRLEKENKNY